MTVAGNLPHPLLEGGDPNRENVTGLEENNPLGEKSSKEWNFFLSNQPKLWQRKKTLPGLLSTGQSFGISLGSGTFNRWCEGITIVFLDIFEEIMLT